MTAQIKAIVAGLIILVVLIIAGLIYWRGSSNATTKADLRAARTTIKVEREALKVTTKTNTRVDAESVQTAQTAEAANREIDQIRARAAARPAHHTAPSAPAAARAGDGPTPGPVLDPDAARVVQLAGEARAAALASSARLQSAGAGTR